MCIFICFWTLQTLQFLGCRRIPLSFLFQQFQLSQADNKLPVSYNVSKEPPPKKKQKDCKPHNWPVTFPVQCIHWQYLVSAIVYVHPAHHNPFLLISSALIFKTQPIKGKLKLEAALVAMPYPTLMRTATYRPGETRGVVLSGLQVTIWTVLKWCQELPQSRAAGVKSAKRIN